MGGKVKARLIENTFYRIPVFILNFKLFKLYRVYCTNIWTQVKHKATQTYRSRINSREGILVMVGRLELITNTVVYVLKRSHSVEEAVSIPGLLLDRTGVWPKRDPRCGPNSPVITPLWIRLSSLYFLIQ